MEFSIANRTSNYVQEESPVLEQVTSAAFYQLETVLQFILSALFVSVAKLLFERLHACTPIRLPPGPSAWPILGHVSLLGSQPHRALHNLAKKYGGIMHLHLGSLPLVVISTAAAAEEFFKIHDTAFGARPSSMARAFLTNNLRNFFWAPYAAYWRHLRMMLDMTTSALDTTSTTGMEGAIVELLRHPDAMKKVQAELDAVVGTERPLEESDIPNLPYLQAVVKEAFRLNPPMPLALPHESTEECLIAGYDIPANTGLFINIYAIQRDPAVWDRPNEFDPDRFLDIHPAMDMQGQDFQLMPFGAGQRQCPGTKLAILSVHMGLARLLHAFDISLPHQQDPRDLDISDNFFNSSPGSQPLQLQKHPRLPCHLHSRITRRDTYTDL